MAKDLRTGAEWAESLGWKVLNPDGWKAHQLSFEQSYISKGDFYLLAAASSVLTPTDLAARQNDTGTERGKVTFPCTYCFYVHMENG